MTDRLTPADWLRDLADILARCPTRIPDIVCELRDEAARREAEQEGSLECPACGGSGHIDDFKARREAEECAAAAAPKTKLTAADVEWVVNDIAELGVKIGDQFFWLYKGESLIYDPPIHDDQDGRPMLWRHVYKREFGECCHPINRDDPTKVGTVDVNDGGGWLPIDASFASNSPNNLRKTDAPPPTAPDLVQQLRGYHSSRADYPAWTLCHEAADAIEALRARVETADERARRCAVASLGWENRFNLKEADYMRLKVDAEDTARELAEAEARAEAAEAAAKRLREALEKIVACDLTDEQFVTLGPGVGALRSLRQAVGIARNALAQGGNDDLF